MNRDTLSHRIIRGVMLATLAFGAASCRPPRSGSGASRPLLAVVAHPDDEVLLAPLLARYAREGRMVYLAIATDGSKGTRGFAKIPAGDSLARIRAGEARCSARTLGVQPPFLIGLEDGGIASFARLDSLRGEIRRIVARLRPSAVVTLGAEGATGHPDHRLVNIVTTEVAQTTSATESFELYYASMPVERLATAPGSWPKLNGSAERYLNVTVPFEPRDLETAQQSFACHESQFTPDEMQKFIATLAHGFDGRVRLRSWNASEARKSDELPR